MCLIKVANRKESSGEYFRFPAGEITDEGVPGQQDQPPSIPPEVSDFAQSGEMSAMVTALTRVVSGERYGGETAAFYQMGSGFNQSLNSPSSTTYSSSSSGQKRGREEECVVSQVGEQQFPFQRVYRGFGGGGDSSSSITSVVQLSDDESTVETVIKNESNVLVEEQNNVAVTSLERAHRAERKQRTETSFSYVDIEQHFGKKQEDAAESLKVSRSTLKRECRKHGIKRWPFPKRKKLNHFSTSKFKHVNEPLRSGTEGLPKSNNYKISQDIMLEPLPNGREMVQQQSFEQLTVETIINSGSLVSGAKQNDVVTYLEKQNGEETSDIEYRTTDVSLSREELKRHFGKKIDDAAKTFGVSRSTMKRACRVNGIKRWPFPKRKKFNPSPSNLKHVNRFVRLGAEQIPEFGICEPLCSDPPPMNATANVAQTITNATPKQDVRTVTIKATYGVEIIRFQLSFSSRKEDLIEKVTKRLPLKDGTFNIKYEDDDGDWVLIACDEDLEECIGISKGKSAIKMSIQPITNQAP